MPDIEIPSPQGRKEETQVGIIIAVIAVLMALVGSLGNNAADDMIVGEVKASNGFAWYQAKRQREYINDLELSRLAIELADNPSPSRRAALESFATDLKSKNQEYRAENDAIRVAAERDAAAAEVSGKRNDAFGTAEILLQVAVVFCSLTLLTNRRMFLHGGILVALAGILLAGRAYRLQPTTASPQTQSAPSAR